MLPHTIEAVDPVAQGKTYDIESFHEGLVAHGLIVPAGVKGVFGRGAVFERVLEAVDKMILRTSENDGADTLAFPPVIDRAILRKVHYLDSFPHLCGSVHSFFGNALQALALAERVKEGGTWSEMLGDTGVVMNPAACYPVYPTFTGKLPADGRLVTLLGWVYRHEPSDEPTRMQSFRVREYIRAGTTDQVVEWRDLWLRRGLDLLMQLQLPAHSDVASDPFFGRGGVMLAKNQKQQRLKFEILIPVISSENPTACCSFNFHQDHFSSTFDIRTADGEMASTACVGFGLERTTMALFKQHGFVVADWPAAVRDVLGL